jgi:hypothetical protein
MFHRSPSPPSAASVRAVGAAAQIAGAAAEQGVVASMTHAWMTTERPEGEPWSGLPFGIEEVAV